MSWMLFLLVTKFLSLAHACIMMKLHHNVMLLRLAAQVVVGFGTNKRHLQEKEESA